MYKLSEELLQFIWRNRLLKPLPLISKAGNKISVLSPGELNVDSGPDFFNARIRVNDLVLAGNIEIHVRTSDWLKHKHQQDRSYDNIILHAVYEHDSDLDQNRDNNVEVLELKSLINEKTIRVFDQLAGARDKLACASHLKTVNNLRFISWMERMAIERLERKVERIETLFNLYNKDYTQTFYTCLLKNFGFKVNALPFEMIAHHLPVQILLKHSDDLRQMEALLLGISGLLDEQFEHKYIRGLQNEFEFLKAKYQLVPLRKEIFKFSKLRPANFPNLRLAQLAMVVHAHKELITSPQNITSYEALMNAMTLSLAGYWKNHYKLDGNTLDKELSFGKFSGENVIINTFAPFFFFYSRKSGKSEYADRAIDLLNQCALEKNAKTRLFEAKRKLLNTAADSQAIINLYNHYCSARKCLKCGVAASILNPV